MALGPLVRASRSTPADPDERRRRIARVAVDIVAREGMQAATIRRIASEVGFSTTVVTHYFAEKQELLRWAYRVTAEEGQARLDRALAADPADLVAALFGMAAVDDASVRLWRVFVAFCDEAARDPDFAHEQRRHTDRAIAQLAAIIRARYGERPDAGDVARLLNGLVQGLSVQVVVDPGRWSPAQIRDVLQAQVRMLLETPPTIGAPR
jgi:AcrR family transcriptional regulator